MLAEIFMLRMEAISRASKETEPADNSRFVPITLAGTVVSAHHSPQPVSGPEPVQTQAKPVPVPRTPGRTVAAVNPYSVGFASTACTKA